MSVAAVPHERNGSSLGCTIPGCDNPHNARGLCLLHYARASRAGTLPPRATDEERLLARVTKAIDPDGCWVWDKPMEDGYGSFHVGGVKIRAHRASYMLLVGPIPEGLDIDHVCHNRDLTCPGGSSCPHRACVNPAHLEPVTRRVNALRGRTVAARNAAKTHCPAGHPYDEANTMRTKQGRVCRTCHQERNREWERANR